MALFQNDLDNFKLIIKDRMDPNSNILLFLIWLKKINQPKIIFEVLPPTPFTFTFKDLNLQVYYKITNLLVFLQIITHSLRFL